MALKALALHDEYTVSLRNNTTLQARLADGGWHARVGVQVHEWIHRISPAVRFGEHRLIDAISPHQVHPELQTQDMHTTPQAPPLGRARTAKLYSPTNGNDDEFATNTLPRIGDAGPTTSCDTAANGRKTHSTTTSTCDVAA